ncbi:MAG: SOS response-associated peptidase [Chloroflexaceae bacterium]|nr:SOS response-associated peptidase [Chloroflexaceae bacterium]
MCGRFTLTASAQDIQAAFGLADLPEISPRYNIAPSQAVAALLIPSSQSRPQFAWLRWGLIPRWAKDAKIGDRLINARSETAAEKPAFRQALQGQRCLILADGFYEWQGPKSPKQPHYFHLPERSLFAFAGLWDTWRSPEAIHTCTILTAPAAATVRPVHGRMPAIVPPQAYGQWLDPQRTDPQQALALLAPDLAGQLRHYPVSDTVNNPRHEVAACLEPAPSLPRLSPNPSPRFVEAVSPDRLKR